MGTYEEATRYAADLGAQHGRNAAEWYIQDAFGGRVTRGADDAAALILRGIEDGDPAIMDGLPFADLSGEWADSLTGPMLVAEAFGCGDGEEGETSHPGDEAAFWHADAFSDVCDAYEIAFQDAAVDAIEAAARAALAA